MGDLKLKKVIRMEMDDEIKEGNGSDWLVMGYIYMCVCVSIEI